MLITRTSILSGVKRTRILDVTQSQIDKYEAGYFSQVAFANLNADDREFIMSGITSQEWDDMTGVSEDA